MTDQPALLAAILAAPEDDTPRLVFADWLDENEGSVVCERCGGSGDDGGHAWDRGMVGVCNRCDGSGFVSNGYAARAEFIRIQCELAKHWHGVGYCSCRQLIDKYDCDNCLTWERTEELRDRERELFASLPLELPDGFFRCVSTVAYMYSRFRSDPLAVYDRGFVDSVSCPWDAWRDYGDAITAAQPVRRVTMTTEPEIETRSSDGGRRLGIVRLDDEKSEWSRMPGGNNRNERLQVLLRARWPSVREWVLPTEPQVAGEFMGYPVVMRRRREESPEPPPTR